MKIIRASNAIRLFITEVLKFPRTRILPDVTENTRHDLLSPVTALTGSKGANRNKIEMAFNK